MKRLCATVYLGGGGGARTGYTYFTHIPDLKDGDTVIVEAPRNERGELVEHSGYVIGGTVIDSNPPETMCSRATKWIIDRVEWDAHRARSALAPATEGED